MSAPAAHVPPTRLPEQLVVLSLDPDSHRVYYTRADVPSAVAAAELVELVGTGRVRLDAERVTLVSPEPTGHAALDKALAAVRSGEELVPHLQREARASLHRWLGSLLDSGHVTRRYDRLRSDRYLLTAPEQRTALLDWLVRGVRDGNERALALAELLDAARVLKTIAPSLVGAPHEVQPAGGLAAAARIAGGATTQAVALIVSSTGSAS